MKKSEIYRKLQIIVINEKTMFRDDDKLEILRELMNREDIEEFSEKQESQAVRGDDE